MTNNLNTTYIDNENNDKEKTEEELEDIEPEETEDEISLIDKIDKIKKKLKEANVLKEQYLINWQRSQADFINFRRRQEEQIQKWIRSGIDNLMFELLPVLDSLEQVKDEGVAKIKKQLCEILKKQGLEEIESDKRFNPEIHEAVETVQGENDGEIVEVIQKGYRVDDRVIRPAKVKVGKNMKPET